MREQIPGLRLRAPPSWRQLRRFAVLAGILAAIGGIGALLNQPGSVEGAARLIDGDSLMVAGREVRLHGIDAPEGRQTCMRNGAAWACGEAARRHLAGLIAGTPVRCHASRSDQHGRLLGTCHAHGRDLNAAMVEDGYALAYGRYEAEQARAKAARRGLWAGEFERPRDWRERNLRR